MTEMSFKSGFESIERESRSLAQQVAVHGSAKRTDCPYAFGQKRRVK